MLELATLIDQVDDLFHYAKVVPFTHQVRIDRSKVDVIAGQMRAALREETDIEQPAELAALIDTFDALVRDAKAIPLGHQVRLDLEHVYDVLDDMRATFWRLMAEDRQAR